MCSDCTAMTGKQCAADQCAGARLTEAIWVALMVAQPGTLYHAHARGLQDNMILD